MFDLSIIIVNWNARNLLRKCLSSIYSNTSRLTFQVFVIDNASRDGSAKMVEREFPRVYLIRNKENLGFARGNNQGFSRAKGRYLLLLNPDTEVVRDALLKMVEYLRLNKKAGAVSGKFIYPDGTFQRYYRRFPTFFSIITTWFLPESLACKLRSTRAYLMLDDDFEKVVEVPQPAGACIMLRRNLFLNETFMDEQFPIFFGDVDLCRRIYNKGWKIFVLPDAEIIHHKGKGGLKQGKLSLFLSAEYFISMVNYLAKHQGVIRAKLLKILFSLAFFLRILIFLVGVILKIKNRQELRCEMVRLRLFLSQESVFNQQLAKRINE